MTNNEETRNDGFRYINRRYAYALLTTATLLLFSQAIIQITIINMKSDSHVVNISGRQRMLSQKISKASYGLFFAQSPTGREAYLDELIAARDLWKKSHEGLRHGDSEMGLPGKNSREIDALYNEMDESYRTIDSSAATIVDIAAKPDFDRKEMLAPLMDLQEHEDRFLKCMDGIVFQYDRESNHKLKNLQILEIAILLIALIVLTLEWRVVFKPAQHEIKKGFDDVKRNEAYLNQLFETVPTLTILFDAVTLNVVKFNAMAVQLVKDWLDIDLNYETSFSQIMAGIPGEELDTRLLSKIMTEEEVENLEVPLTRDKIVLMSAKKIESGGKQLYLIGLSDITTIKLAATFDSLTSMLNRRAGLELLTYLYEQCAVKEEMFSICFIDIDRLKFVNDLYGHPEGDWYIKTVANVIKETVGERYKSMRYGGDEIVLVSENMDISDLRAKMKEVEAQLEKTGKENFKPYSLSVSYGFASNTDEGVTIVYEMIELADLNMYEHKKTKKFERRRFPRKDGEEHLKRTTDAKIAEKTEAGENKIS